MKRREANFELLRIVAMLMIITLHYLDKGGILPEPTADYSVTGCLAWGVEAFCVCAVNVYVLISAYFLAESSYRPMKVVRLWLQVVFYSVGIEIALILAGIVPLSGLTVYEMMNDIFPVIEEHYWFVTAYILMYLLAPLMNGTLRTLPEKTYRQGILLLLLLLSLSKSVLPVKLPTDRLGYDALWFLCLYMIGAYMRYYGAERAAARTGKALGECMKYIVCAILIFISLLAVHGFYMRTGSLADFINRQYQYNSILCLAASVFLFRAFREIRIAPGGVASFICKAASASFGVYLIHEHKSLRYLWPVWAGTERFAQTPLFLLHWLLTVIILYGICMIIDFIRQYLFQIIGGLWTKKGKGQEGI